MHTQAAASFVPEATERDRLLAALFSAGTAWDALRLVPTVPCLDWCDRCASAVSCGLPGAIVAVIVADVSPAGHILSMVRCGAGGHVGIGRPLSDLRWRLELLEGAQLPAIPSEHPAPTVITVMSNRSITEEGWQTLGVGHVVSIAAMLPLAESRRAVCMSAGTCNGPPTEQMIAVLSSLVPAVARAAARAIDHVDRQHSDWISPREQDVLDLLIVGKSVPEIAEVLCRSPHTIHDHVKALHRKFGAKSRGELVAIALGHGREWHDRTT